MYCNNCGKEIKDSQNYCPYCNSPIRGNPNRGASFGLKVLSFIFPLLGIVLYLCFDMDSPIRSKQCGKCALAGIIVKVLLITILYFGAKITIFEMTKELLKSVIN